MSLLTRATPRILTGSRAAAGHSLRFRETYAWRSHAAGGGGLAVRHGGPHSRIECDCGAAWWRMRQGPHCRVYGHGRGADAAPAGADGFARRRSHSRLRRRAGQWMHCRTLQGASPTRHEWQGPPACSVAEGARCRRLSRPRQGVKSPPQAACPKRRPFGEGRRRLRPQSRPSCPRRVAAGSGRDRRARAGAGGKQTAPRWPAPPPAVGWRPHPAERRGQELYGFRTAHARASIAQPGRALPW